jgi:iron-sulfur cluster repair protein YtfE (RIC family)
LIRIHAGLREQLARLLQEVENFLAGRDADTKRPVPDLDSQLREHCLTFCRDIHEHHTNENDRGFPLLERRFPGIGLVLNRIRHEHQTVARIREDIEKTLTQATTAPAETIRTGLRTLAAELEAHFDHEERQLVAALNAL